MCVPRPTSRSIPRPFERGVMDLFVPDAAQVEDVAHLSLQVGRLLLLNGADTDTVETAFALFAAAFGCEAHLMVTYEALLLTVVAGDHFRTKIGHRVPAMNVGLTAIDAVNRLVDEAASDRLGLAAWLAGAAGTWLRLELGRRHVNAITVPFAAATLSGIIGGGAVLLGASGTPSLCLVAPGMIIVPGVPFINGVQDLIRNHMTLAISRLGFAGVVTTAIAFGLFVATTLTGVTIPVEAPARAIGVPEDAMFSALAALGYAFLFNVPARVAWACVVCGIASHTTRTFCVHLGIDIIVGTLIGGLVAGFLAQAFAWFFRAPAATFAFPGVVAMVPGAYAFRAAIGCVQIVQHIADAPLVAETLALGITVVLMVGAIAIGIAIPAVLFAARKARQAGALPHTRN